MDFITADEITEILAGAPAGNPITDVLRRAQNSIGDLERQNGDLRMVVEDLRDQLATQLALAESPAAEPAIAQPAFLAPTPQAAPEPFAAFADGGNDLIDAFAAAPSPFASPDPVAAPAPEVAPSAEVAVPAEAAAPVAAPVAAASGLSADAVDALLDAKLAELRAALRAELEATSSMPEPPMAEATPEPVAMPATPFAESMPSAPMPTMPAASDVVDLPALEAQEAPAAPAAPVLERSTIQPPWAPSASIAANPAVTPEASAAPRVGFAVPTGNVIVSSAAPSGAAPAGGPSAAAPVDNPAKSLSDLLQAAPPAMTDPAAPAEHSALLADLLDGNASLIGPMPNPAPATAEAPALPADFFTTLTTEEAAPMEPRATSRPEGPARPVDAAETARVARPTATDAVLPPWAQA